MNSTRKLVSVIVLLLLAAVATAKLPTMASPISESTAGGNAQDTTAVVTVEPELQARFAAGEKPGYLIYFRNQADLSAAYRMDWEERGQYVVETLQAAAKESQANVRKYLDEQGVDYQSFWIENVIVVDSSTKATFQALLSFNEVESIRARRTMQVIDPEQESVSAPEAATAVEPNIAHVLAPDAWAAGYRGEGMVVANVDTGVRGTHQALVRQYRGTTTGSNDYNWLGAAGGSPTPVDDHGHGTHTMGTIVGEDATLTNQIGIAPGAQWIACDACEGTGCPDAALLTCAQWIAAPYPVGNPAAPDPNMRPNVVNNSWGDCGQTYDNWFESSISAWQAAGIYPVFSNGNASNCGYSAPPGLNTVGNPARSGNVTGVGSSGESNGLYATHSNWGPTDNLDTVNPHPGWADLKPQVIAPGVSIRSSTPGSDTEYQDGWSGTSMSAPHVTGLVALMMQAGSCLVGDYAAVETIIEETATPIYYDDMGTGARWPNYASGWGEINVAAAVEAASQACGPSGTLTGTVTDSSTTNPVQGADVTLTQSPTMTYQLTTDAAGLYERVVPTGVYTVEVAAFGYLPASINNANVYSGTTTTVDVALDPAPTYTVSGVVADANTGWPLYASVDIAGYPGGTIWTDPVTGYYSVVLPAGASYDFTVESFIDGYLAETRTVGPITGDVTENFALGVDELACNAPGYSISGGLVETFDSVTAPALPAGWAVVDVTGTTGDWKTNAGTRYPSGNAAHSAPNVAYFNAFSVSSGSTRLYRQSGVDMTSLSSSSLSFWMFRDDGYSGANDTLQVQVSLDNGASWINVGSPFSRYSSTGDYWEEKTVDLSAYSTETNLRLGFLAVSAYGNDIHIDDMILGGVPSCNAPAGALVVGSVYDKNTNAPLNGAEVSNDAAESVVTVATPLDTAVDDAFYAIYSPSGSHVFTATMASNYGAATTTLNVVDSVNQAYDFYLPAGWLSAAPDALSVSVELGSTTSSQFSLDNMGDVDANFTLRERNVGAADILLVAYDSLSANALQTAVTTLGYTVNRVTASAFQAYTVDELLAYGVVMYVGSSYANPDNLTLLTAYLDAGGSLYVTDNDFGYYQKNTDFYQTYLQATYVADDGGALLTGEDIMAGLNLDITSDPFPDSFTVNAEGTRIFAFPSNAGGVRVERNGYKAIYTSFDYQHIASSANALDLADRILTYLAPPDLIPWLSAAPLSGTVAPAGYQVVSVDFDASGPSVPQPGVYQAEFLVTDDTPYGEWTVPVTMTVTPPASYGLLEGTVTGLGYCDANPVPAVGATVDVEATGGMTWTLTTDDAGYYSLYLDETYSPITVTVSAAGHEGGLAYGVDISGQVTTTQNFDLRLLQPCVTVDPAAFNVEVLAGDVTTRSLTISNGGAAASDWELNEVPLAALAGTPVRMSVDSSSAKRPLTRGSQFTAYATQPNSGYAPQDLINDGSFEADPAVGPWTEFDSTACTPWIGDWSSIVGVTAYDGLQYFWAGGYCGAPNNNSASQTITIPANQPRLSFWYYAVRSDPDDPSDNGTASVKVDGTAVWTLEMSQANNTSGWVNAIVDLSAYAGQSVNLTFGAVQGASGVGNVFFDQIETLLPSSSDVPWLSEDPITGTLGADTAQQVTLTFDSTGLSAGQYEAVLTLNSADPMHPSIEIPVTMTVMVPAITLDVTVSTSNECGTATNLEVAPGTVVYYCYTIHNTGNLMLPTHTITDSVLGPIDSFSYDLYPSTSESVIYSHTMTADAVSTVTWMAENSVMGAQVMATDTVSVTMTEYYIYLPIVLKP